MALVAASPDIGLQLRQQQQHQQQQQQQQGPTGYVYQAPQLQQQQGPTHQQQNEQNNQQYFNQQQQTFNLNQGVDLNMGFNNQDGLQINQGNQGVQNSFNTEPIITKDVYFHTAPEEDEQPSVQIQQQFVQPQKHYKIIFIKAPSSGLSQVTQQVPVYPQVIEMFLNID